MSSPARHAEFLEGGADASERLRAVDWSALDGLGPLVAAALAPVLAGESAERALDRLLRAHRTWTAPQRAAAAWALFGVALWRRRLCAERSIAWSDEAAAHELPSRATELLFALVHHLGGAAEARARAWSGFARAAQTTAPADDGHDAHAPRATSERADMPRAAGTFSAPELHSLPDWLWNLLVRELSPVDPDAVEARRFASTISLPGPIFLRANRLRCTREELRLALARENIECAPSRFAPDGLVVRSERPNLLACQSFRDGLFEVQDEGSQLLGALVEARPGESILDLCAGAGGKSLQLAAAVGERGRVVCSDIDLERLERLRGRTRRAGASCIEVAAPDLVSGIFDRVLVDAPCSELGALRRGPDARWRIDRAAFVKWPALQLSLLQRAARFVRPGGRLVYATCTLRHEENEDVAAAFESSAIAGDRSGSGFARVEPGAGWLDESFVHQRSFRALPHRHGTDGFFAAVWERAATAAS